MNAKQLKAVQAEKDTVQLKREIAWLKRHIKVREAVLAGRGVRV